MYQNSDFEEDYIFIQDIHGDVSRTFELAAGKLSGDLADVVRTSYLLCRIPDTIEDSGHIPVEEKPGLLDQYLDVLRDDPDYQTGDFISNSYDALEQDIDHWTELDELDNGKSYWELLENTDRVFNVFAQFDDEIRQSVEHNVGEMVEGMRDISSETAENETEGIRIGDFDELADYNYIVAGTVGNLLTDIFTYENNFEDEDRLYELSEDFGHFLQTINILKDPYNDYINEDAVFAPDSLASGDFHEEVIGRFEGDEVDEERLEQGILELAEHADQSTENVVEYIDIIDKDSEEIGGYLRVPALLATATLREARENPMDAFEEHGISIGKAEALTITQKAGEWKDVATAVERIEEETFVNIPNRFKAGFYDFKSRF